MQLLEKERSPFLPGSELLEPIPSAGHFWGKANLRKEPIEAAVCNHGGRQFLVDMF